MVPRGPDSFRIIPPATDGIRARATRRAMIHIERIGPGGGARWRSIRLRAHEDAPYAFGTTVAEASGWPAARWEQQVEEIATFVAVSQGEDVGVVRAIPHPDRPDAREVIGMWVAAHARRRRVGAMLMRAVGDWARSDAAEILVLDVVDTNA